MRRLALATLVAAAAVPGAAASPGAEQAKTLRLPVPKSGNVSVATFDLAATGKGGGFAAAPRLQVVNGRALGADVLVVSNIKVVDRRKRKLKGTVVVVHRHRGKSRALTSWLEVLAATPPPVELSIGTGFSGTALKQARNVVQANPLPAFLRDPCARKGRPPVRALYAGAGVRALPPAASFQAGCDYALDQPVAPSFATRIGAQYCSVDVDPVPTVAEEVVVTIACNIAGLTMTRLDFGAGTIVNQIPLPGGDCKVQGHVQECTFAQPLALNRPLRTNVRFGAAPPSGGPIVLRVAAGTTLLPDRFGGRFPEAATPSGTGLEGNWAFPAGQGVPRLTIERVGAERYRAVIPGWGNPCNEKVTARWDISGPGPKYTGTIPWYSATKPCPEVERAPATWVVAADGKTLEVCWQPPPSGKYPGSPGCWKLTRVA